MRIKWLGLMALVLAVLLPVAAIAEDDPDEGWDEDTPVYGWEVRDGTLYVKEGVEYLGYLTLDDEEQYGLLTSFDLSCELDDFHFDAEEFPEPFDKLQLPSSLRIVGGSAFYKVHYFEEIILPEGVEEVLYGCMDSCGAKRVTLPATVRLVEPGAFVNAFWLENIEVSPDNPWYASVDGVLYTKDKTTLVAYPPGREDLHFDVPAGVKEVGPYAFFGNWSLHSVSLPFGVERIGRCAFADCVYLEAVSLPPTLREVEIYAFGDCVSLERLPLPRQVEAVAQEGDVNHWDTERPLGELVFDNTPALRDCWMKEPLPQEEEQAPETHEDNWQDTFDEVELYGIINPENARDMVNVVDSIYDGQVVASFPCGTSVRVTGVGAEWYRVKWYDDAYLIGYIPADQLLVRRNWENLYKLWSVEPVGEDITYYPADRWLETPCEPEPCSLPQGAEFRDVPDINGQWISCSMDTAKGFQIGCFSPADVALTRYDTGDGKTYGMVISDDLRNRLNLRQSPSKDSASLGKYFSGTQVEILAEEGDWYKVRVDFQEGWMVKQYVRIVPMEPKESAEE